jgi:hypothetical protein
MPDNCACRIQQTVANSVQQTWIQVTRRPINEQLQLRSAIVGNKHLQFNYEDKPRQEKLRG